MHYINPIGQDNIKTRDKLNDNTAKLKLSNSDSLCGRLALGRLGLYRAGESQRYETLGHVSRVGTVWGPDDKEWTPCKVETPHASVETSGVQVPDPETLGQGQPGGEVLGVLHLDEQQPRPAFGA